MNVVQTAVVRKYTPADFFGEPLELSRPEYLLKFDAGIATAELAEVTERIDSGLLEEIRCDMETLFMARRLLNDESWSSDEEYVRYQQEDGKVKQLVYGRCEVRTSISAKCSLQVVRADGSIDDPWAAQERENRRLLELFEKHIQSDVDLYLALHSYSKSFDDLANSLVHLYEVRDRLSSLMKNLKKRFSTEWSDFGLLCNNLPRKEGRHRGKFASELTNVTDEELRHARRFARSLIEAYVEKLDQGS